MAIFQVSPPEKFAFKPEEWLKWIRRFECFRLASELNKKDEKSQVNTLICSMGDILQSFGMSKADKKKYFAVKQKFEGHFIIKRNIIFECARFNMRVQCGVDHINEVGEDYTKRVLKSYSSLFTGLGKTEGEYKIRLKQEPTPYALTVPRKVPLPLLMKTKEELDRMLHLGVISHVVEPTQWCTPMVVAPKPSGDVRTCVDLTNLNENVLREIHPLPSVDYTLAKFGGSKIFSKMDANSAFWQRKLSDESCQLTTFLSCWGRFCFNRLPYGISTGSEQFQRCMGEKLEGLEGVEVLTDDIIVHGANQQQHNQQLRVVLNKLVEANITLNLKKCEFNVKSVKVLGHVISSNGISADPSKVNAITSMQKPNNVKELRSFLGMVNQFSKSKSHLASETKQLRVLLCKDNQWYWGQEQNKAFNSIKQSLVLSFPILALYDPNKEIKVNADASPYGIGGVVLQKQEDGSWKPISYVSRALTPTEARYNQIKNECLALFGHVNDQVTTSWGKKSLVKEMNHVPGKQMYTSDTLSTMSANAETSQSVENLIDHDEMVSYI
eukprot:gene1594-16049_t